MKKVIALICTFAICAGCLCGCGNGGGDTSSQPDNTVEHSVDVMAKLALGEMPEAVVKLGTNVTETENTLNALEKLPEGATPEEGYTYYYEFDDGVTTKLDCEGLFYCYKNSQRDKGISAIVSFDKAYDFDGTFMMSDVTSAIKGTGTTFSPTAADLFFVLGEPELSKYTAVWYGSGTYRLYFFFYDSFLSATVLMNTETWGVKG